MRTLSANDVKALGAEHFASASYVVIDTETTGRDPAKHFVWSFAAVVLSRGPTYRLDLEEHTALFDPPGGLPVELCRKFGWNPAVVAGCPSAADPGSFAMVAELIEAKQPNPHYLVGHNVGFDVRFLEASGVSFDAFSASIDTLSLARSVSAPRAPNTLTDACARYRIDLDANAAHGALVDARACALLLPCLLRHVLTGKAPLAPTCPKCSQRHEVVVCATTTVWKCESSQSQTADPTFRAQEK